MRDLEEAIELWKHPFQGSVIYDQNAIEELEDHLRLEIDRAIAEGRDLKTAWAEALSLIGTEQALREEYLQVWMESPSVIRWWRSIASEGNPQRRSTTYYGLRLLSLCVGAFGILVFATFFLAWEESGRLPGVRLGSYWTHDAPVTVMIWSLTALFNLTPFRGWTTLQDRLRGGFVVIWGLLGLHTLILGIAALPMDANMIADAIMPFIWSGIVFLGPALWLSQLRWRDGDPFTDTQVQR